MTAACEAPGHRKPAPAWGHTRLCDDHRLGIRRDLKAIAMQQHLITGMLIPSPAPGHPQGRAAGTAIPVNLDAALWLGQVTHDLAVITAWTRDERGTPAQPGRRIADMAAWLIPHAPWIAHRPWAGGAAGMLTSNRNHAIRILDDHPRGRAVIPLPAPHSTCPECDAPAALSAIIRDPAGCIVRCARCRHEWEPAQWARLGHRLTQETTA